MCCNTNKLTISKCLLLANPALSNQTNIQKLKDIFSKFSHLRSFTSKYLLIFVIFAG